MESDLMAIGYLGTSNHVSPFIARVQQAYFELKIAYSQAMQFSEPDTTAQILSGVLGKVFLKGLDMNEQSNPWTALENFTNHPTLTATWNESVIGMYRNQLLKMTNKWYECSEQTFLDLHSVCGNYRCAMEAILQGGTIPHDVKRLQSDFHALMDSFNRLGFDVHTAFLFHDPPTTNDDERLSDILDNYSQAIVLYRHVASLSNCKKFILAARKSVNDIRIHSTFPDAAGTLLQHSLKSHNFLQWYSIRRPEVATKHFGSLADVTFCIDGMPFDACIRNLQEELKVLSTQVPSGKFVNVFPSVSAPPSEIHVFEDSYNCCICLQPIQLGVAPCKNSECGLNATQKKAFLHYDCYRMHAWSAQVIAESNKIRSNLAPAKCPLCRTLAPLKASQLAIIQILSAKKLKNIRVSDVLIESGEIEFGDQNTRTRSKRKTSTSDGLVHNKRQRESGESTEEQDLVFRVF
jgi:hypothetical protein